MIYEKMFFPIGGGDELEQRLHGALLIAKYFDTKLEILQSRMKNSIDMTNTLALPKDIQASIDEVLENQFANENEEFINLTQKVINGIDKNLNNKLEINIKEGVRSTLVEQYSKFCDIVIATAPPSGITTATFETAVLKSGKPVLMFPRTMTKFSIDSILIGWNNSPEVSRAVTSSIEILKRAKKVQIISSKEYLKDETILKELINYLKDHKIDTSYEIVETTRIPGQALLNYANKGEYNLIVAGAFSHKGLKELMFGGTTRYLLENSQLPVFLSH